MFAKMYFVLILMNKLIYSTVKTKMLIFWLWNQLLFQLVFFFKVGFVTCSNISFLSMATVKFCLGTY